MFIRNIIPNLLKQLRDNKVFKNKLSFDVKKVMYLRLLEIIG